MTRLLACLLMIASMGGGSQVLAAGGMHLNRSIVLFQPGQAPREDVLVLNAENETLYVSLEIQRVDDPGTENEELVTVLDPQETRLIATPNKLVIPPNGRKSVRLVNLGHGDDERIYRINVTPIVPPLDEDSASLVRIIVAYQLLVIVQPTVPREDLSVERVGNRLVFSNRGNTNFLISEGSQCDNAGENCIDLPTKRIYAGMEFEVDLEGDQTVNYKLTANGSTRQVEY